MSPRRLPPSLPLPLLLLLLSSPSAGGQGGAGTVIFTTLGRSRYGFDIFSASITHDPVAATPASEFQLTDGVSVNYNGFFPSSSSLLYISERNGSINVYLDLLRSLSPSSSRRESLQLPALPRSPLLPAAAAFSPVSMKDRPSVAGDYLVYVSTHEPSSAPRRSWAAVYSTHLPTGRTRRLTPYDIEDFSPAVSPSGDWIAVASPGVNGWSGEVEELKTGIFVSRTGDGSQRTLLVDHGGWPCWADESTLYFHRRSSDSWWSVYRANLSIGTATISVVSVDRITPPGFHAFTPAASAAAPGLLAVATRRPSSKFRHIELVDLSKEGGYFVEVTRRISPYAHHYNPFLAPDASRVSYHRCRGRSNGSPPLLLENIRSLAPEAFSLFRVDGSFPSFSPDGARVAFVELPGLYVVNSDGSGAKQQVFSGNAFPTAWDWKRKGVIYTSSGPDFAAESTKVDILSITIDDGGGEASQHLVKQLTAGGENNAFPSPSPDGNWVVFRSGRSGHKNLYIMNATEGEVGGIRRLTEGPWTDTMCNWSPDGQWIAFASDRDNPGGGSFAIYMVHPDGTGVRKVVHSGQGGRTNHPWFSPDSKSLVFTSDYAGVSAEPISNPHHYQPYGEIFTVDIDGSNVRRLTHNSYEDGTPTWSPFFLEPKDVAESLQASEHCGFADCHWLNNKASKEGTAC